MEELITCDGTVHSVIFQNAENGYTVLRLLTEEGEVLTVVGCIPCVAPGEHLTVSGVLEQHPQHGEQLRAPPPPSGSWSASAGTRWTSWSGSRSG